MPTLSGILLPGHRKEHQIGFRRAEVSRDTHGDFRISADAEAEAAIAAGEVNRVMIPASGLKPTEQMFSRFLGKVAIECMGHRLLLNAPQMLPEFIDAAQVDLLRNYARFGKIGLEWPYSERQIYPVDFLFPSTEGKPYEVLHEWDFMSTEETELYFRHSYSRR